MKIYIIGCSCSGKTTLADKLSKKLGLQHIELDRYWWLPGWQERDKEEFRQLVQKKLLSLQNWIVDGNYSRVRDLFLKEADLIIWLNLPFITVFLRSITRSIKRAWTKEEICNGNRENWKNLFSGDSMPAWIIRSYKIRKEYGEYLKSSDKRVIELKNKREIDLFIASVTF